jgi:hypothetical protein
MNDLDDTSRLAPLPADFGNAAVKIENDEILAAIESPATVEPGHVGHAARCVECESPR